MDFWESLKKKIKTSDNENYILDFLLDSWIGISIDEIVGFAQSQISKRSKKYSLFIKTKKYTQEGSKYEEEFLEKFYTCVQKSLDMLS